MNWLGLVQGLLVIVSTVFGIRAKYKEGKAKATAERNREIVDAVIDGVESYAKHAPFPEQQRVKKQIDKKATVNESKEALDSVLVEKGYKKSLTP